MTIHSAKGLEFPVVFLVGLTEGIFPSFKSIEERKRLGLEEERRLCYVAITRAQKKLFILDSEGISPNGNKKTPSRFLNDIGTQNYKRIGIIEEDNQLKDKQTDDFLQQENEFLIGTEVYHHFFKKGKILSINKKKNSYLIQFDQFEQPRNISMNYFNQNKKQFVDENNKTIHDEPLKEDKFVFEKENENEIKMKQKDENITHKNEIQKPIKQTPIDLQNKEVQNEKQSENKNDIKKAKKKQDSFKINEIQEEVDNLWKRNDVPHQGWNCVGITDLGSAQGICQMCGKQIIRYVHHMVHPNYHPLNVGCICAGKMEGDIETAKKRENEFKNKEKRKENFLKLKWKTSRNGNSFLKNKKHHIVLYQSKDTYLWKYAMDGQFCNENYQTKQEAIEAAFEMLDSKI